MILGMVSFLRNTFYYRNYYDWKFIHVVLRVRVQYILGHVATSLTLFSLLSTWKENLRWWIITRNDSRYAINVASELQLHTGLSYKNLCENISINICWSLLKFGISHRPKNLDRGIVFFIYLLLDRIFLASSAPVAGVGIALALICQRLIEVFPLFLQFWQAH